MHTADESELRPLSPVPGVAVAWWDGLSIRTHCAGTNERGDAPIEPTTRFQAGSTSKLVAAIAALQLVGTGQLPWDEPIVDVLRSWRPDQPVSDLEHVTVERLLSHRSGATVHGYLGIHPDQPHPSRFAPLTDVRFERNVGFRYSGGGYQLLQLAIEDVSGQPFEEFAARRVLQPSGAALATYVAGSPDDGTFTGGSFEGAPIAHRWQVHTEAAAAGLWATARDVAALFASLVDATKGKRPDLLPEPLARRIISPSGALDEHGSAVGHGCFLDPSPTPTWCAHDGRTIGFCSVNRWWLDGSRGIAVLTNGFPGGTEIGRRLVDAIARQPSGSSITTTLAEFGLR